MAEVEDDDTFYNYEVTYAINCAVRYLMKLDGFEFQYEFESDEAYQQYNDLYDEAYAQSRHELYTGGYEIHTTIDLAAQGVLQEIIDEELDFSDAKTEEGIYELQGALTVVDNETGKGCGHYRRPFPGGWQQRIFPEPGLPGICPARQFL